MDSDDFHGNASENEEQHAEDPIWGDWGPSAYNDGKGITIKLIYFPLDQSKGGKRKNAKPYSVNKRLAMHEDFDLDAFLVSLAQAVKRYDLLPACHLYHSDDPSWESDALPGQSSLEIHYSVHGTSDKDIELDSVSDFKGMISAVCERAKPQLNIDLKELKFKKGRRLLCGKNGEEDEEAGPESDADAVEEDHRATEEVEDTRPQKRKKTTADTPMTELERDMIDKTAILMEKYGCRDKKCPNEWCFPYGPNFDHGAMVPKHFRDWSAAWAEHCPGVDVDCPPSTALFDFSKGRHGSRNDNTTDLELLANRRLRNATNATDVATPTSSASQVNVSFQGLADVLKFATGRERTPPAVPLGQPFGVVSNTLRSSTSALPPRMLLATFCATYELLPETTTQLQTMGLAGPHLLRLMENTDLRDGGLTVSQVAEVRDAEQRWLADVAKELL